jgi:ribose transport system permease protein
LSTQPADGGPVSPSETVAQTRERRRKLHGGDRFALPVIWLAMAGVFAVLRPDTFATTANIQTIFSTQSILVILALGALLPLIVGEFDLSIAATMGLSAIVVATLDVQHGWPILLAVVAGVAFGAIVGLVNAVLVVGVGVDALVATLGVSTLAAGLSLAVSDYLTISGVDDALLTAVNHQVFGMPLAFFYGLALMLILWVVLSHTPLGRHLYFVGQSREVARLSGLPVFSLRAGAFIAGGALAGLAGVVLTGTLGAADPAGGAPFLLPAYAAAFLGSTTIRPGFFNPIGTVLAAYFLTTGVTGLQLLGLEDWVQQFFYGIALIFAVVLSKLAGRRRSG